MNVWSFKRGGPSWWWFLKTVCSFCKIDTIFYRNTPFTVQIVVYTYTEPQEMSYPVCYADMKLHFVYLQF